MFSELLSNDLLSIYLKDHLAGSTFGVELARRARDSNRGNDFGAFLADLAQQIAEDRESLRQIMDALDVAPDKAKNAMGWAAERFGRLKPNGRIRGYSPLSRLLELEGLQGGVRAKLSLWLVLQRLAPEEPRLDDSLLATLVDRAERQLEGLRQQLDAAAGEAFRAG
jgi:hypothetical protein